MKWISIIPVLFLLHHTISLNAASLPVWEQDQIRAALKRNEVPAHFFPILAAIRHSESNGEPGLEFGIMNEEANDYSSQAGWCACTVWKSYKRWNGEGSFITFLGSTYSPPTENPDWVGNVTYWAKFYGSRIL